MPFPPSILVPTSFLFLYFSKGALLHSLFLRISAGGGTSLLICIFDEKFSPLLILLRFGVISNFKFKSLFFLSTISSDFLDSVRILKGNDNI